MGGRASSIAAGLLPLAPAKEALNAAEHQRVLLCRQE